MYNAVVEIAKGQKLVGRFLVPLKMYSKFGLPKCYRPNAEIGPKVYMANGQLLFLALQCHY